MKVSTDLALGGVSREVHLFPPLLTSTCHDGNRSMAEKVTMNDKFIIQYRFKYCFICTGRSLGYTGNGKVNTSN